MGAVNESLEKVPYSDIRKGITALMQSQVMLLSQDGVAQNDVLVDSILDATPDRFYRTLRNMQFNPDIMDRLISDAALTRLPNGSPLYLEGLAYEAERICGEKQNIYPALKKEERLKLAGFLYRSANERPLPYEEWWSILFPATMEDIKKAKPEDVRQANEYGLRKMLRCLLEYNSLDLPSYGSIDMLWKERGWEEYSEHAKPVHMKMKGDDVSLSVSLGQPETDNPTMIENLLVDLISYVGEGSSLNLNLTLVYALKILNRRKYLAEHDYFLPQSRREDRQVKLQAVLEDKPLW
jgi:hypothetical protein